MRAGRTDGETCNEFPWRVLRRQNQQLGGNQASQRLDGEASMVATGTFSFIAILLHTSTSVHVAAQARRVFLIELKLLGSRGVASDARQGRTPKKW